MKDPEEYPEQPGEGKSQWDARQIYVRELQELDQQINGVKMRIELRGTKEELIDNVCLYMSLIRWYYRELRPLFLGKGKTAAEAAVALDKEVKELTSAVKDEIPNLKAGKFDTSIESKLEELHNKLQEKRFRAGLVVPMGMDRDDTGILGWEG